MNYLNEFHKPTAAWLRELSRAGCIDEAVVDDRSILDVKASDLIWFNQCHFFAGIAGWCEALRLVGWPADIQIWTGSPPCQPFSRSGKKKAKADPRHLAPQWLDLITEGKPKFIAGEQVADAIACGWVDDLCLHLEEQGYAVGYVVLPACSVGAPHERKRLFFCGVHESVPAADRERLAVAAQRYYGTAGSLAVPDSDTDQRTLARSNGKARRTPRKNRAYQPGTGQPCGASDAVSGVVADSVSTRRERRVPRRARSEREDQHGCAGRDRAAGSMDNGVGVGRAQGRDAYAEHDRVVTGAAGAVDGEAAGANRLTFPDPLANEWSGADWLLCKDGRFRAVAPGTFPLADGVPHRVGRLRGYGNAIVPRVGAEFLAAFMLSL
jgi:DNA (cytosine-5)-methyltransferase 1